MMRCIQVVKASVRFKLRYRSCLTHAIGLGNPVLVAAILTGRKGLKRTARFISIWQDNGGAG